MAARPAIAVLISLACTGNAVPTDDQSTMLQGKLQFMGHSADRLEEAPLVAGAGVKVAGAEELVREDYAGRVRRSLVALLKTYAPEEHAEILAGRWGAALARGKQAMKLPSEADDIVCHLLDVATDRFASGTPVVEAWTRRAPRLAELLEALAAKFQLPTEPGQQAESAFTWASREFSNMVENLVPGQPVAAYARWLLLMAKDYATAIRVSEQVMNAISAVDAALQRGDFRLPAMATRALATGLDTMARRAGDGAPVVGRLAALFGYFGKALQATGEEPESWTEALLQIGRYARAGNQLPVTLGAGQLMARLQNKNAEESQGVLVQAAAGALQNHGERLGLSEGLMLTAGNLLEMIKNGTASLSSAHAIAHTLRQAAGDQLLPLQTNLVRAATPLLHGGGMLPVPEWGLELATKLAARLWGLWKTALGPKAPSPLPTSFAALFEGLVPQLPGQPALQGLLEAALGGTLDRALTGDGNATADILRSWAGELRAGAGAAPGR